MTKYLYTNKKSLSVYFIAIKYLIEKIDGICCIKPLLHVCSNKECGQMSVFSSRKTTSTIMIICFYSYSNIYQNIVI